MNTKYIIIITTYNPDESQKRERPVWESTTKEYAEWVCAHHDMRRNFCAYATDRMIAGSFSHDCAYIEEEGGRKVIMTITKKEG